MKVTCPCIGRAERSAPYFLGKRKSAHNIAWIYVGVASAHLDGPLARAIKGYLVEEAFLFILRIMLEALGLEGCSETKTALENALHDRRGQFLAVGEDAMPPTMLPMIALRKNDLDRKSTRMNSSH